MEKSFFAENRWSYPKTQKYLTTYQFNFQYFIFSVMSNYFLVSKIHNWFFFSLFGWKKCEIIKIGYFFTRFFNRFLEIGYDFGYDIPLVRDIRNKLRVFESSLGVVYTDRPKKGRINSLQIKPTHLLSKRTNVK